MHTKITVVSPVSKNNILVYSKDSKSTQHRLMSHTAASNGCKRTL